MSELFSFVLGVVMTIGFVLYFLYGKPKDKKIYRSKAKYTPSDDDIESLKSSWNNLNGKK